jgi:hypothetical protein
VSTAEYLHCRRFRLSFCCSVETRQALASYTASPFDLIVRVRFEERVDPGVDHRFSREWLGENFACKAASETVAMLVRHLIYRLVPEIVGNECASETGLDAADAEGPIGASRLPDGVCRHVSVLMDFEDVDAAVSA